MSCQEPAGPSVTYHEGELELKYGQEVSIPGQNLRILFSDLPEDSRCPTLVQCVWAGNAQISLIVNDKEYQLNTLREPRAITIEDYSVNIVTLEPYPVSTQEIAKESYIAKLSYSRN